MTCLLPNMCHARCIVQVYWNNLITGPQPLVHEQFLILVQKKRNDLTNDFVRLTDFANFKCGHGLLCISPIWYSWYISTIIKSPLVTRGTCCFLSGPAAAAATAAAAGVIRYYFHPPIFSPGVKISYDIFIPGWKYRNDIFTPLTIFSPPSQ